jgi:(2S)-methylsuccinyl-CoA dehydrogenase
MPSADLAAAPVLDLAHEAVESGVRRLASAGGPDVAQVLAYDLAHAASRWRRRRHARLRVEGRRRGSPHVRVVADAVHDLSTRARTRGRVGHSRRPLAAAHGFLATYRSRVLGRAGIHRRAAHLDADFEMVQDSFRRFAEERIKPVAEHVHRHNEDVPEEIISGLAEMGALACPCPRSTAASPPAARATTSEWCATEELAVVHSASAVPDHAARDPHAPS